MKHILYIPAGRWRPIQIHAVRDQRAIEDLMDSEALEFWDYHLGGFQAVWLHHTDDEPVNIRATVLVEDHGRDPGNHPLRGPVVIKGVTLDGDWVDAPPDIVLELTS